MNLWIWNMEEQQVGVAHMKTPTNSTVQTKYLLCKMLESIDTRQFVGVFTLITAVVMLRTIFVLLQIRSSRRRQRHNSNNNQRQQQRRQEPRKYPIKTMIVLGSGGHTTEMLRMTQSLDPRYYHPIIYVKASTDTTSALRLQSTSSTTANTKNIPSIVIHDIPRSREVGQSYASSILSTIHAAWYAFALVARERPALILTNGPGTCVPLILAALVGRILGYMPRDTRTVFVESYCRVQTLSLTGKVLFHLVDMFAVHWKELHQLYPDTTVLVNTFQQY